MRPNGRGSRRKALCEYRQVAGHRVGTGAEGLTAHLTDCPAFQLWPASLLCCPPVTECHVAAGTAFCQQRHAPLPLPLCCLQLCPGTWPHPAEWKGTCPGVGCLGMSTIALSACQGPFIFLSYVVLSKEVRKALKFACSRKPTPDPALTTKSTLTSVREPGSEKKRCLNGGGSRPIEPVFLCTFYLGTLISTSLPLRRKG